MSPFTNDVVNSEGGDFESRAPSEVGDSDDRFDPLAPMLSALDGSYHKKLQLATKILVTDVLQELVQ